MMPTFEAGDNHGNGNRPASPWPYTQPALVDLIEEMRGELQTLADHVDEMLDRAETAIEFVGARVEMARVRERRRNRRGTRKAVRG
jgi:hypothetical protein